MTEFVLVIIGVGIGSLLVFFTIGFSIGKNYATFITKNQESRPDKQLEDNELKHDMRNWSWRTIRHQIFFPQM